MQSGGGGTQQGGGGGHGRNTAVGPPSSSASPSSSSSAVSTPQLGFESMQQHQQQQQQQQHHHQQQQRQSLQQQLLRKPEGKEAMLAYQSSGLHGVLGGGNFASGSASIQLQQSRKFMDSAQQHGREEAQNRGRGVDPQMMNPIHQAYMQYAFQAQQAQQPQQKSILGMQAPQQMKMGMVGHSAKDQDPRIGIMKMQDLISMQAANQAQTSISKRPTEHIVRGEKQSEDGQHMVSGQRSDQNQKPPGLPTSLGQSSSENNIRPMPAPQSQPSMQNMTNNQLAMAAQMQAMQALALERNIDLSLPQNSHLVAQLIPLMQSRLLAQQKANENNMGPQSPSVSMPKQQATSPRVANESSPRANSSSDVSGHSGSNKPRQTVLPAQLGAVSNAMLINNPSNNPGQQFSVHGRENQLPPKQPVVGNGMSSMQPPQSPMNLNQGADKSLHAKSSLTGPEALQMQHARQVNRASPDVGLGNPSTSQVTPGAQLQKSSAFTKQQLHVLKAQILAFRRLKKGDGTLPRELLQAIVPPPLEAQVKQEVSPGVAVNQERPAGRSVEDHARHSESSERDLQPGTSISGLNNLKGEALAADGKVTAPAVNIQGVTAVMKEPAPVVPPGKEDPKTNAFSTKLEPEVERGSQRAPPVNDTALDRGKAVATQVAVVSDTVQAQKAVQAGNAPQPKDVGASRKYHGPLFDFPFFTRKHDAFGSSMMNNNNNLTLAYDVKDILVEEGMEVLKEKRSETIRKISRLLALNSESKRIRPDLVLKLQIEEKKLRNMDRQNRVREDVEEMQQEVMAMPDRVYRKFVRLCQRQRNDLARHVQASQKAIREKQLKSIFQWRKKLLESHWGIRDARTARNRGVAKYHERMLREFSKRKDDGRNKRMEALKNNDVERYREMLLEQQTSVPGEAAERYEVLSSFLSQTEDYLHKLGSKITAAKNTQEVEEAANTAAAAARAQGLSEEEVRSAASCAGEEVLIRNRFSEMNAPRDGSSVNKYYTLAHAVNERVIRQPSMLRKGTLRDYQLVGLQWMLSLYNNKLNGILADEMGLGKTVQVMALIAYLMEFKGNYGPHLIIVPNAVLVNWKSELHNWLPSVSCIYYVGVKDQRAKLFSQEVLAMKFNVLVTTYEFIMYDRSKLSKIDWKYIIIDEAQRMKDRESVLARDLDRYRCQRRLLLTGTPLQNDLKELWSLLNLLLPEVFDNRKAFHDWFSKPFQKETQSADDDWLETEKKVIIIHRLHQILEPFMLRRRVEDVEGSLPPKISIILRCRMSAIQGTIYDWIKSTGTLRVDPEDEKHKVQRNPIYTAKVYKTLNNRCMELRKTCNHPLLNYPYFNDLSKDFLVRSCGKLWVLDRVLIKLQRTGHRVLLFSTMTKLLDILEEYLQWRRLVYRRIDGTTSLEDRESAIVEFNRPDTDCFIFLLSIRAAGRGLNLQTADTVIIYDPDPNPKNEEQAVARAHRIGQTREVKVIYMEAVVDKVPSHQKEDEYRNGGEVDSEDDLAGKDRYIGSIESLIRNNIQQYKIEMADEVINAGRFDQRTTHEERRLTLETMLHDEERFQETVHDVPSLQQVNRMIARSEEEVELFDQMDEEFDWEEEMTRYDQVPKWMRAGTREVNTTIAALSKKPIYSGAMGVESSKMAPEVTERKRGRPKGKKVLNYAELDDDAEFYEASSEEKNGYSGQEDGEIEEFEDEEVIGTTEAPAVYKDHLEDGPVSVHGYEYSRLPESTRNNHIIEQAGSSGSSADSRKVVQIVSPSISSQKFGSLSALDARPGSASKRLPDDLEEGEIALSGESHMDLQQSGSLTHDREEGEDEQVLQPKIKRKRSIRLRPKPVVDRMEEKPSLYLGDPSQLQFQGDRKNEVQGRIDNEHRLFGEAGTYKPDHSDSSLKSKRNMPSRKNPNKGKTSTPLRPSRMSAPQEDAPEHSRESWDAKVKNTSRMPEGIQRRCKNVLGKIQRRIDKEGQQIIPLLTDLWKRTESNLLNLRKIEQRVERFEYNGVMEFVADVQLMLKSGMQYFGFTHEVRSEARKVHELFFDVLKIAFPDIDFREARSALSFSSSLAVSASSVPSPRQVLPGQSQIKRQRQITEVEPSPTPPQKPSLRGSAPTIEETRTSRTHMSQRETRFGSNSSSREVVQQEESRPFTHPGELVICKKKRKDREKSGLKMGNLSAGPVSPTGISRGIRSPGPGSIPPKDTRSSQQTPQQQGWGSPSGQQVNGSGGTVGWANPVKRMRTDAGKRRPSHL